MPSQHPFDLKRPCKSCPFRRGVPCMRKDRVTELLEESETTVFYCHGTVDYDGREGDDQDVENAPDGRITQQSKVCAGLLILLEKEEAPNQAMRIAERLRLYDRRELDMKADVYDSREEMLETLEE